MNTQANITKLLRTIKSQTEPLFKGDTKVQLEIDEGLLTVFVIDVEGNVMYPVVFEETDDFVNQSKLVGEVVDHVKSEQRITRETGRVFNKHEHSG